MWIYMAHKSTFDKALKAHYKQILNYNIAFSAFFWIVPMKWKTGFWWGGYSKDGVQQLKKACLPPRISWGGFWKKQFGAGAERTGWDIWFEEKHDLGSMVGYMHH